MSHLWWDWVWQRPQQLLSRLAGPYRVLWIEEPRLAVGPPGDRFELTEPLPDLRVARLVSRGDEAEFRRRHAARLEELGVPDFQPGDDVREAGLGFASALEERLEREAREAVGVWRRGPLVLWLYTPAAVLFIDLLRPDLVVYDVMDDLAGFAFAPPQLVAQERELFARADLVFTGGRACTRRGATATRTSTSSPAASTRRTSPARWNPICPPARRAGSAAPDCRLLRRHRRAPRPRPAGAGRGGTANLELGADRPGAEDRGERPPLGGPTSTTSGSATTRICRPT